MNVSKKIVTDESMRPIAVQIAYPDWLEIERRLNLTSSEAMCTDLSNHEGVLSLTEDPMAFQNIIRGEWE